MTNIKMYARQQIQALDQVLRRERLTAALVATIQGPLTLTYRLRVQNPTKQSLNQMLALDSTLQAAMLVESVRVQQANGLIEIQIPSPAPITPNASQMAMHSDGLRVAIGWDAMSKPVSIDLAQHGALFWIGPPRRGKTQSMRSTLYAVSRSYGQALRYCVICQRSKLEDWQAFDSSKHSLGVVCDFAEIEIAVKWFAKRTQVGRGRYEYILIVDDLPSILDYCKVAKELSVIASVGAGVGVHLLAGTQAAGSKAGSGGEIIENTITARLVYKPASKATAARNAGQGGLDLDCLSNAKGDAVLLVDGYPERVATSLAHDSEIATLPQGRMEKMYRVWQQSQSVNPVNFTDPTPVPTSVYRSVNSVNGSVSGVNSGSIILRTVNPVNQVNDTQHEALRLPASMSLSPQQKLQLYAAYKHFGAKGATMRSVFGGEGGQQSKVLNDAIAFAEGQPDDKIIKFPRARVA